MYTPLKDLCVLKTNAKTRSQAGKCTGINSKQPNLVVPVIEAFTTINISLQTCTLAEKERVKQTAHALVYLRLLVLTQPKLADKHPSRCI